MVILNVHRRISRRHIFKLIIWVAALLGIIWQLDMVFETYFHYQTVTDTSITLPEHLDVPSLTICVTYADLLDIDKLNDTKEIDRNKYLRHKFVQQIAGNLTINEIFQLTPTADNFYDNCYIRRQSSRRFSGSDCDGFEFDKFWTQEYICYKMKPPQKDYPFNIYAESFENPGQIYSTSLKLNLTAQIYVILPVISSGDELVTTAPSSSKMYSNAFLTDKLEDKSEEPRAKIFRIKYDRTNIKYLGFPYDRFICASSGTEEAICMEKCVVDNSLKKIGKLMPEVEIRTRYNLSHVSWQEMNDPHIASQMDAIIKYCDNIKCNMIDCNSNYTRTSYTTRPRNKKNYYTFDIGTPNSPFIYVINFPKVNIMDLIVYIVSFTGAWFGFAFVDIGSLKFRNIFSDKSDKSELNHLPSYRNRKTLDPRIANLHMQHYASLFRPPR